ncbi:MAG TPA: hypothetical protein DDZ74_15455, partial [Pseudomonas sp.]|nr:hypothetical protein [Pseudomonas sp.]
MAVPASSPANPPLQQERACPRRGRNSHTRWKRLAQCPPIAASGAPLMSESAFAERIVHHLLDTD